MPPDKYTGQNLRGRSFKGEDLTGANFSKADIRGADFTNATLKNADFTGAKAGLQRRWTIGLLIASWLLSAFSGLFSIFLSVLVVYVFHPNYTENFITGIVCLIVLLVFCFITLRKGLTAGLGAFAVAVAFAFAGVFAVAGARAVAFAFPGARAFAVAVAGAVAVIFTLFSAYIGWRSLTGNGKDAWVRSFAVAFAATGGTSFRDADLTDADFTGATLRNTDFRKANLTRTRFYEVKKLDLARVGDSILAKRDILNLLVTCNGREKSYLGANLKGANLIGADLKEANLKDADISKPKSFFRKSDR
ncbi:pentapeptide repeat-containing protein [Nodularia sp. UHCC 0506]|nr:pentapeptide repeat-containing protein [Nodularia sp. UHCC 0506]MEA5515166.1 pentapeptide repeat-containing protein [Nodularia sp. UHCC 0506]